MENKNEIKTPSENLREILDLLDLEKKPNTFPEVLIIARIISLFGNLDIINKTVDELMKPKHFYTREEMSYLYSELYSSGTDTKDPDSVREMLVSLLRNYMQIQYDGNLFNKINQND